VRKLILLILAAFACSAPAAAQSQPQFVPVFTTNFPDPFILRVGTDFYAYATNAEGNRGNVQMAHSTNLADWELMRDGNRLHDAMPTLPPWAREGWTWAPEVIRTAAGYVIHFTAKDRRSGAQCLGAAFSTDPRGPFTSTATEPLVCQTDIGGTIDSSPFRDADGQLYLYYKNDGNARGGRTQIWGQRLTPDGLHVTGDPVPLLRNDVAWEAHVIEAPTMVRHGDGYLIFYSANHFGWEENQRLSPYAIGYATCRGPLGPCTDAPNNPLLYSYNSREAGCLSGPGHQSIFTVGTRTFMSFHAHEAASGCRRVQGGGRYMYIAPLGWKADGTPELRVSLRPTAAAPRR
jgi:beta-xylosidase